MKAYFKKIITRLLWLQVRRLRAKHNPIVVAVAGSVGKTGTKSAIATVLSEQMRVAWQDGNYNDIVSVPLIFFGKKMPRLLNPFGWLLLFLQTQLMIQGGYPYDIVILELGVDHPGDMELFHQYLRVDYGVITAISAEHMEHFKDIDAVAKEELSLAQLADTVLIDADAMAKEYQQGLVDPLTYGQGTVDCRFTPKPLTATLRRPVIFTLKNNEHYELETGVLGKQNLPAMASAVLLASKLELTNSEIKKGLAKIKPRPGRMQLLKGEKGSLLIDDTYNSSPKAVKSALDTLYEIPATQKIALLGQMNELGRHSKKLHDEVGSYCDPKQLNLVVTIGDDANKYLAAAAEKRGCKVMRCPSPYHAADVARPLLKKDTVVLIKGSQNGVFAEEALKLLLANPKDKSKLVRQSRYWLAKKRQQFSDIEA